ncbi:MAG TPA: SH3 domain-containing protein [Gammaproteobacteria bacterium]|nr:SH3 domain-containing protein [Gammaproteobacteria bacterium]
MQRAILFLLLMLLSLPVMAGTVYVQSTQAELHKAPRFDGPVTARVDKGTPLKVLKKQGRWIRVAEDGGKPGWVFRFLVASHRPLKKETVLKGDEKSIQDNARRRASNVTTAGAARGLQDGGRQRLSARGGADYAAVRHLEQMSISDRQVIAFLGGAQR